MLKSVRKHLAEVDGVLSFVYDEEQDALNNWPESLEGTDRYQQSESACDALDDALALVREASEVINNVIDGNL